MAFALAVFPAIAALAQAQQPDGGAALAQARKADAGVPVAQKPDGGVPSSDAGAGDDEALRRELERSLQQDSRSPPAAQQPGNPPAPDATGSPSASGYAQGTLLRGLQSLNPDLSVILDTTGGYERRGVSYRSGDDPDLRGGPDTRGAGFTVQEVELAFSAIVDPYFKGEIYLTIPNLAGLEVEEAFATTTSLPYNLQVKAGSFRSAFGRQNGQHLHVQDFTRRPLINAAFLGVDGMRGPGAQVSWLAPLPFYVVLYGEAFSLQAPLAAATPADPVGPVASHGGGTATDLTYASELKYFFPFGEEWALYGGMSFSTGVSPGFLRADAITGEFPGAGRRAELYGADLYFKWKPPNVSGGYTSLAWQTEAIWRHFGEGGGLAPEWDGGLYTQLVLQVARTWFVGARADFLGLPTSSVLGSDRRGAVSITWQGSEFSRVRGYFEVEHVGSPTEAFLPTATAAANPRTSFAAYVQLEFSIGAHGAHPY
jgi:hypothetical protein